MKIPQETLDTLSVRPLFCKKILITSDQGWLTQPTPVLAMLTKGKGKVTIAEEEPVVIDQLLQPYFMRRSLMRRPAALDETGFEAIVIHLSIELLGGIELTHFFDVPLLAGTTDQSRIRDLMLELHYLKESSEDNDILASIKEKRILFELFEVLIQNAKPKKKGLSLDIEESRCLAAVSYLKDHFNEPFDLEKLLEICHFSHAHFFRLFKKLTGVTPKNYQLDCRIEAAQKLLLTTNLSILEIGERIGWHDQFHFSRIFKSRTGYSPQQFRSAVHLGI